MDFRLPAEQRQLRDAVREFADEEIRPVAKAHDKAEEYPWEVIETAAENGLLAPKIPPKYGGPGLSTLDTALLVEELSAADPGIGLCVYSTEIGCEALIMFGTEDQKEEYLTPLASGEAISGIAISEPDSGSDVSSVSTRAKKDGDEWVINGNKMWISNGTVGDFFIVLCRTDPDAEGPYDGFSQLIVEADRDGFSSEKITGKLGVRATDTAELVFDEVRVPEENLLGNRDAGFHQQMEFFDEIRTGVAAQGVGIAKGAAERALEYAQEREQFDRPIADFQAIQHKLAEMYTDTEAARMLTHEAAWTVDNEGTQMTQLTSMAKEFASRIAVDVANKAVQIHGGAGFVDDHDVERFYRDAKITQIYEGTTEIQKNIIARELLDA